MTGTRYSVNVELETEVLVQHVKKAAWDLIVPELSFPDIERTRAEEALRLAHADNRFDDKVIQTLVRALEDLLDFQLVSRQMTEASENATWRSAMAMAMSLVNLKREELPTIAASKLRSALDEITAALHVAYDEGVGFEMPRKLGRYEPRSPKPPLPKRPPSTMKEGLLAALPSDGTPIPRAAVEDAMLAGNFAADKKSASRAFRELIALGRISESGVRGRTKIALNL